MKPIYFIFATLFVVDSVTSQGIIETVAAVMGLLPTSQILLAGGGLIGLKMAVGARILSLLGLVSEEDQNSQFVNPHKTIDDVRKTTKRPSPSSSSSGFINNSTTSYFGMPKLDEEGFHKVSDDDFTNRSVDGNDDGALSLTTSSTPTNPLENAFFPIPGLQIDCENSTGICGILHMDKLFPSVFLPSEFAKKSGINPEDFNNMTSPMFEVFKQEAHGSNESFLFYPLFPAKVASNNVHENGVVSVTNESQIFFGHNNGSMMAAADVEEFDFHGFHEIKDEDEDQSKAEVRRGKRLTEDNIEMYLSLVNKFDDEGCFSRLICEVGADPERFGNYGHTVDNLFKNLNHTKFDVTTDASHYISHYKYGKENGIGMCGRSSICNQNMTRLIHPLNEL